jgi:hypothetical protein
MTMLPCVEDWKQLTPWNVNSRSWYCLATQIYRLLIVSEGSYTTFTRGRHGFLSHAILIQSTPCHGVSFNILLLFSRLFLGVSSGSVRQYFRPKCTHFCVSSVLSVPPISYCFADVVLMCCEKNKKIELREHYAVCAWCSMCVCVRVSPLPISVFEPPHWWRNFVWKLCHWRPLKPHISHTQQWQHGGHLNLWGGRYDSSVRFRIINICGYRCSNDFR